MKNFRSFLIDKTKPPPEYRRNPIRLQIKHKKQGKPYEFLRNKVEFLSRSTVRKTELFRG